MFTKRSDGHEVAVVGGFGGWIGALDDAMIAVSRRRFVGSGLAAASWLAGGRTSVAQVAWERLADRFAAPVGFMRAPLPQGSFGAWLRLLPLKPADAPVVLHTGALKPRQDVHAAVIEIDVGSRDLQQCADAVMRLRAEWLFAQGRGLEVAFNDTGGGKPMRFEQWARGFRPRQKGRGLVWTKSAEADASAASFRRYLDTVFVWAGTQSLEQELVRKPVATVTPGDVIIKGGFPGHAVIVSDVVVSLDGGERRVLLAQSYMPAQSIHVLKNLSDPANGPWFTLRDGRSIETPEWTFSAGALRGWR